MRDGGQAERGGRLGEPGQEPLGVAGATLVDHMIIATVARWRAIQTVTRPGPGDDLRVIGESLAILAAGFWAGMINTVVGSGTLVTFPVLLLFGYPPLVANVSNNIGLVGGNISGTIGYRGELAGRAGTLKRLLPASGLGGITGALLLLVLPAQ